MRDLARRRLILWAVSLTLLLAALVISVPRTMLLTILNGVFLGVTVSVLIVYAPLVYYTFVKFKTDRVSQFAIGIGLLWLSIAGQRLYWIIWQMHGRPFDWQSNYILSVLAYLAIIGGCLFVTAPGYPPADSTESVALWGANRKLLITLGCIGGGLAFALSCYQGPF